MPNELSIYKQYEVTLREYYGAERNPLAYPPVAQNIDVAHELAIRLETDLSRIRESDLARTAMRGLMTFVPRERTPDNLNNLKAEALKQRLRYIVVNSEYFHARLAPGDFNFSAGQDRVYREAVAGIEIPPAPKAYE